MPRFKLGVTACIAALSLSCGVRSGEPAPDAAILQLAAAAEAVAAVPETEDETPAPDPRFGDLVAYLAQQRTGLTAAEIETLASTILSESERHDLDMRLVLALMYVESRYNAFAVSPVGAMGLMQILPATGEELAERLGIDWRGPATLFDPVANVQLGVAYVKQLAERYGSIPTALAAYNWGPGHVDGRLRRGSPVPRVYPALVMNAYGDAMRRHRS